MDALEGGGGGGSLCFWEVNVFVLFCFFFCVVLDENVDFVLTILKSNLLFASKKSEVPDSTVSSVQN